MPSFPQPSATAKGPLPVICYRIRSVMERVFFQTTREMHGFFGQDIYWFSHQVNGLLVWVVTHVLFLTGCLYFDLFPGSIIQNNWGGLLVAANVYGYFLTFFSYAKALLFPSHPEDRKFSGSIIYDIFMGVEFNPRFGKLWDFKLFHNGRPGIIAWTLINLSFAFAQVGRIAEFIILLHK